MTPALGTTAIGLTQTQQTAITDAAAESFGPDARVTLFGSQVGDRKRGGDIDLLVECPHPVANAGLAAPRMAARIILRRPRVRARSPAPGCGSS